MFRLIAKKDQRRRSQKVNIDGSVNEPLAFPNKEYIE